MARLSAPAHPFCKHLIAYRHFDRAVGNNRARSRETYLSRKMERQEAHESMNCPHFLRGEKCDAVPSCWSEPVCITGEPVCGWKRYGRSPTRPYWFRKRGWFDPESLDLLTMPRAPVVSYPGGGV